MRVLAHVHTFNDADIIDRTIAALQGQTRPLEEILIVDNASADGTLERPSVRNCTVLRHPENRGTSGTVHSGFRYALDHDYDWIWLFDADSLPAPDALERLLDFCASLPRSVQDQIGFLACRSSDIAGQVFFPGAIFSRRGLSWSKPVPGRPDYPCDFTLWSGCLYRLAAVNRIGLPNPDYVLDWGEIEYAYRMTKAGYKGFIHQEAVLHHNIRGQAAVSHTAGDADRSALPPIRCYYNCRNALYFSLYEFTEGLLAGRLWMFVRLAFGLLVLLVQLVLPPRRHGPHLRACARGIWHGVTGNITARY